METDLETEHDAFIPKDCEKMRAPHNLEWREYDCLPRRAKACHLEPRNTEEGFDAVVQGMGFGARVRICEMAVIHAECERCRYWEFSMGERANREVYIRFLEEEGNQEHDDGVEHCSDAEGPPPAHMITLLSDAASRTVFQDITYFVRATMNPNTKGAKTGESTNPIVQMLSCASRGCKFPRGPLETHLASLKMDRIHIGHDI